MSDQKNHQQIGQELDLFTFSDLVGSGLPLFTPKGTILRRVLQRYIEDLLEKEGFDFVSIPYIAKKDLYEKSGHLEKFSNDMFPIMKAKDREYILKPANCPHHIQIFARRPFSYREMPQRYAESTIQYRSEQSGELEGLARVLGMTLDDSHIFARPDQIKEEFAKALRINKQMLEDFKLEYWIRLSAWDPNNKEKYLGDMATWEKMQGLMEEILTESGIDFKKVEGEAAFYGPKMDLMVTDSLGKEWQLSTIQVDFNLPLKFDLSYLDSNNQKQRPIMLHRATFGSFERFLAMIIEHTQGNFPTWLSPVQVVVIPISEKHVEYAKKVVDFLIHGSIRVELNDRSETMQSKIRDAQVQKVPYMIIVGNREEKENQVAVRKRDNSDLGTMEIGKFLEHIQEAIESKK